MLDMGDLRGCQQCSDRGKWATMDIAIEAISDPSKDGSTHLHHQGPTSPSSFLTKLRPQAKPLRPTVGIDPRATAVPKAPAVRTGCAHSGRAKYRREGPEMTTT